MDNNQQSLTQQIIIHLFTAIENGTLKPGDRLPAQRIMAERFGVSRTVIRDALKILEGQNLIRIEQGSGAYITSIHPAGHMPVFCAPDDANVVLTPQHMNHLIKTVTSEAVREIAENGSDDDIDNLVQMVRSFARKFSSRTSFQERFMLESSFHIMVGHYSNNPVFEKLMVECTDSLTRGHRKACSNNKLYSKILEINLKIVECIKERNPERAALWVNERYKFYSSLDIEPEEKGYLMNSQRWIFPIAGQLSDLCSE